MIMFNTNNKEVSSEIVNVFIYRILLYSLISLIVCFGLEQFGISISGVLYFIPFVITLMVIEHIHVKYNIKSFSLITIPVLFFLLGYYLAFTLIFLLITGVELKLLSILKTLFGHGVHFLFAAFLSNMYAKLRLRKRNKKK